jgi:predicted dehydrogenase
MRVHHSLDSPGERELNPTPGETDDATRPVRVAVIGAAGWAGGRHVAAFRAHGAEIVALLDPSSRTADLARQIGADVLSSPESLSSDIVDLAVVALPSSMQPELSARLLHLGLRVLVEKPLGSSFANAAVLAGHPLVDDRLMVGYTLHHHPAAKALATWVASSNVVSVSARSAARKVEVASWRAAPEEGGVTVVNGVHAIEYVASLFPGEGTVHDAHASGHLFNASVPDYSAATMSFLDGPLFRLECYWSPWQHTTGLNRSDWFFEIDVVAHEGRRLWSNWSLHEWDRMGSEVVRHFPEVDLFFEQAGAALRFARGEKPVVGYSQALRATKLADEIVRKGHTPV